MFLKIFPWTQLNHLKYCITTEHLVIDQVTNKHLNNSFCNEIIRALTLLSRSPVLDSTDVLLLIKVPSDLFLSSGSDSSTLHPANLHFIISICQTPTEYAAIVTKYQPLA